MQCSVTIPGQPSKYYGRSHEASNPQSVCDNRLISIAATSALTSCRTSGNPPSHPPQFPPSACRKHFHSWNLRSPASVLHIRAITQRQAISLDRASFPDGICHDSTLPTKAVLFSLLTLSSTASDAVMLRLPAARLLLPSRTIISN